MEVEFTKIRVSAKQRGILRLELENPDDFAMAMIIEMHPKLSGGDFQDKEKHAVINRVDEVADAEVAIQKRSAIRKAMNAIEDMSYADLKVFADAIGFDSTQSESVLRNLTEELAESDADYFNDLISGKAVEIQALVKQAINKEIITYEPVEGKFTWTGNKQTITVLSPIGTKNEIEKLAEWLQVGGNAATEIHKKLKGLVTDKKPVTA